MLRLLLDCGADVNSKDSFHLTALMLAASAGQLEMVKTLEKAGALFDVSYIVLSR